MSHLTRHPDGVYKSGFATTQEAYEKAVKLVFESLDRIEKILDGRDYLVSDQLTAADVRLLVTIVRYFRFRTTSALINVS